MQTVLVSFRCTILCCFFAVLFVITDSKGAETRLFAFKSVKIIGNSRISSQQLFKTLGITIPTQSELRQNMDFQGVSRTLLPPALAVAHLPLLARSSHALVRPALNFSVHMRVINPLPPIGATPESTPGPIKFAAICGVFIEPLTAQDPPTPTHANCPESEPCP